MPTSSPLGCGFESRGWQVFEWKLKDFPLQWDPIGSFGILGRKSEILQTVASLGGYGLGWMKTMVTVTHRKTDGPSFHRRVPGLTLIFSSLFFPHPGKEKVFFCSLIPTGHSFELRLPSCLLALMLLFSLFFFTYWSFIISRASGYPPLVATA